MSYLKMALQAMKVAADERGDRETQTTGIPDHVLDHAPVETYRASTPERVLTCYECGHFRPAINSPNPTQAWGHCKKRDKGRYGVATACEAILTPPDAPGAPICSRAWVEPASLFGCQDALPDFEKMRYIASLVKVSMPTRAKAEALNRHFARLMETIRKKVRSYEQALVQNKFEPYIDPDVLQFYLRYEGSR